MYAYLPIIIVLAAITVRKGIQTEGPIKYYLLTGGIIYIMFALTALLDSNYNFTSLPLNFFLIGMIIENLFFGLGLALKFKLINDEKNVQKNKAILLESQNRIATLEGIVKGEEIERTRIAKDLHDSIGSLLAAAKIQLFGAEKRNADSEPIKKASNILNTATTEVRRIAHNMLPSAVAENGIISALHDLCLNINMHNSINCTFESNLETINLSEQEQSNLYRIAQEITNNILKHANCSFIELNIKRTENKFLIDFLNDGKTFNPQNVQSTGMGLKNIEHRINLLNSTIEYIKVNDNEMRTTISIPIVE